MQMRHKILLVDDDQDLLDLYQEILAQLPSRPEISTSSNGARAMAMLEAEPFTLLVCDLNMPKMDGLQVLSIVRRKYPELRTVVLTSVMDEQFRSRVYGLGVDLFWQKPGSGEEIKQFIDCIESLIGRETQAGFRGVQSKSLVDIIQLECISHNSTLLKIINGPLTGRIWILDGDIIDAETEDLNGEAAFHVILSWKTGSFESLAAEPNHTRVINNSYQGLLLETAQAQDEAMSQNAASVNGHSSENTASTPENGASSLLPLSRFEGVEFVMALKSDAKASFEARGLENPQPMADWSRKTLENLQALGDRLQAGVLQECECMGPQQNVALARQQTLDFCIGWQRDLSATEIRESMKKVLALWVS
jgi:CheY-like chemotaxis protein